MQVSSLELSETNWLGPFLINAYGDRYLYEINRNAFNKVGARTLYRERFGDVFSQESMLNIIVGTDSGLLLEYLGTQKLPEDSRYLFVELPEVQDALTSAGPLEGLSEQVSCVAPRDWRECAKDLKIIDYFYLGRVNLLYSFAADDGHYPGYLELGWTLRNELEQFHWEVNASLGGEEFILRQLDNLAENRVPAIVMKSLFLGKTAVLLGGGPSLDDIFPWLKEHREHLVVLAVSRVCRRLLEVDVIPDMVFSIDPHGVSFDVSKEMLTFGDRTLFVNHFHVSSPLLGQWRGPSVFVGPRCPWPSALNIDNLSGPGPTVTNSALAVAVAMGFSQVVLAGVDLCYSREGHTHAQGSNERLSGPQLGKVRAQVETNAGWLAETDSDLASAVQRMGEQARQALTQGCRFVNPAAGAAKIAWVDHILLEQIAVEPLERPAFKTISDRLPLTSSAARTAHYHLALDELSRVYGQLQKMRKLAMAALEANDGLFGRHGMKADFKHKLRMDKIETTLNKTYADLTPLVKKFGIRNFLKIVRPNNDGGWTDEEIEHTGRVYYEAFQKSTERLQTLIREAQERLRVRLEEESHEPDWSRIFRLWRNDDQTGRAVVWQHQHRDRFDGQAQTVKDALLALREDFNRVMGQEDTAHRQRSRKYADLSGVRSKAALLLKNKDREGLSRLAQALQSVEKPEAPWYRNLVVGMGLELDKDYPAALEAYSQLMFEEVGPMLEEALRRALVVSLRCSDWDNGLTALDCLSAISPFYLRQYAELLRLVGEHRQALDTYADYLAKVPDDLPAMIKLGQYYQELNIKDGARLMYDSVLKKDPGNNVAQILLKALASSP